jgi:ferredoxin
MGAQKLVVDWIACDGRGLCAELLPEVVSRDPWGFPIVEVGVSADLASHAKRAVKACPRMALRLESLD